MIGYSHRLPIHLFNQSAALVVLTVSNVFMNPKTKLDYRKHCTISIESMLVF